MNWASIQEGWNQYKVSAKLQWDKLSEQQIAGTQGKREHLASRVQEAYAVNKEEAERQIMDWQSKQRPSDKQATAAGS